MPYSSYDHDKLEAASNMCRESAEAEQAVFDSLKKQAAAAGGSYPRRYRTTKGA